MKRKNIERIEETKFSSSSCCSQSKKDLLVISDSNKLKVKATKELIVTEHLGSKRIQANFPREIHEREIKQNTNHEGESGLSSNRGNIINSCCCGRKSKDKSSNKIAVFDFVLQKYYSYLKSKAQEKERNSVVDVAASVENKRCCYKSKIENNTEENSKIGCYVRKSECSWGCSGNVEEIKTFKLEEAEAFANKKVFELNSAQLNKFFFGSSNSSLKNFNAIQKLCFGYFHKTNEDYLLAAPTGCGKTAIMEFAVAKVLADEEEKLLKSNNQTNNNHNKNKGKATAS